MNVLQWNSFSASPIDFLGTALVRLPNGAGDDTGRSERTIAVGTKTIQSFRYETLRNACDMYLCYSVAEGLVCQFTAPPEPTGLASFFTSAPASTRVNAYYLPWSEGNAYWLDLFTPKQIKFFATAPLNGCCVYVNGSRRKPVVMHANYNSDDLAPVFEEGVPIAQQFAQNTRRQLAIYKKFYAKLATALETQQPRWDTRTPTSMFGPDFYFQLGGAQARVFGLNRDEEWTLYYNIERVVKQGEEVVSRTGVTAELWPNFTPPG